VWDIALYQNKSGSRKKFYYNKITKSSFWSLPPDVYGLYNDDKIQEAIKEAVNLSDNTLFSHFPAVPPTDKETDVIDVVDLDIIIVERPLEENETRGQEEIEPKAVDIQFVQGDKRYCLKPDLVAKCNELGIQTLKGSGTGSGQVMNKQDIWTNEDKFFALMHLRQKTNIHEAACYQGQRQDIEKERHKLNATKRKADVGDHNVNPNIKKINSNKKRVTIEQFEARYVPRHMYAIVNSANAEHTHQYLCACNR